MLIAYGLNYKTAPLTLREQLSVLPRDVEAHLQQLHLLPSVNEVLVLSTCNRTEWYIETTKPHVVGEWLSERHMLTPQVAAHHFYCHQDEKAIQHLLALASGLDSMVIGETEIFGQIKTAFAAAKQAGTLGESLEHLFQFVFAAAKNIRTTTQINAHPLSIAFVAVHLAKRIFADLKRAKVLLVGAGETIDLVARYLYEEQVAGLNFANRSFDRAESLAARYQGQALSLSDIPLILPAIDIVITATDSPLALIGKGLVERAVRERKHKPIFMVDLAIPRDIEPEVGELADVYLYNIDDLNEVVAESLEKRQDAASRAAMLVQDEAVNYQRMLMQKDHVHLIKNYRQTVETIRDALLAKAIKQLQTGGHPEAVITQFAKTLTNHIMHKPSSTLRRAAETDDASLLAFAAELFDVQS